MSDMDFSKTFECITPWVEHKSINTTGYGFDLNEINRNILISLKDIKVGLVPLSFQEDFNGFGLSFFLRGRTLENGNMQISMCKNTVVVKEGLTVKIPKLELTNCDSSEFAEALTREICTAMFSEIYTVIRNSAETTVVEYNLDSGTDLHKYINDAIMDIGAKTSRDGSENFFIVCNPTTLSIIQSVHPTDGVDFIIDGHGITVGYLKYKDCDKSVDVILDLYDTGNNIIVGYKGKSQTDTGYQLNLTAPMFVREDGDDLVFCTEYGVNGADLDFVKSSDYYKVIKVNKFEII